MSDVLLTEIISTAGVPDINKIDIMDFEAFINELSLSIDALAKNVEDSTNEGISLMLK